MPGKCKFQDSWLSKIIYKDWLVKDDHDIHFARCRACCKSIKLQTMGEAALTSHAGGAGHKAALRKLMEGHLLFRDEAEQLNGRLNQVKNKAALTSSNKEGGKKKSAQIECFDRHITVVLCCALIEDTKEEVSDCLHLDTLDKTTSGDWSDLHHSPNADSVSHTAEMQDASPLSPAATEITEEQPDVHFTGTSRLTSQRLHLLGGDVEEVRQQRKEALEQQQQMKFLEWENRMKVLAWEQDLVKERKRATRQKEKAFRMKKAYYKAKLRKMGESVPLSSSSSSDEEEKTPEPTE